MVTSMTENVATAAIMDRMPRRLEDCMADAETCNSVNVWTCKGRAGLHVTRMHASAGLDAALASITLNSSLFSLSRIAAVNSVEHCGCVMRQVFICDAIRTPIGRYGGALAQVRADDLGAIPLKALMERNPQVDWAAVDDVYYGCANQAGEDNRNVARMAALLAGLPDVGAGRNDQSPVRLGARCRESGGARHSQRRSGTRDRRRRREHDARAVRDGQGGQRVLAHGEDRRHDDRLALRQSADEGEVWRRFDAGDGRERRGRIRHRVAPTRMRSRCAVSSATRARSAAKFFDAELTPVEIPQKKGEPLKFAVDEHPRAIRRSKRWRNSKVSSSPTALLPRATHRA